MTKEQSAEIAKGTVVDTTKLPMHPDYIKQPSTWTREKVVWKLTVKEWLIISWERFSFNWLHLNKLKGKDFDKSQKEIMFQFNRK